MENLVEKKEYKVVVNEVRVGKDSQSFETKLSDLGRMGYRVINSGYDKYNLWAILER